MTADAIRQLLSNHFGHLTGPLSGNEKFVDDRLVDYVRSSTIFVKASDLFDLGDTDCWRDLFAPGAGWIHFNLLRLTGGGFVVTVRRGPESGVTEAPAINASIERRSAALE